MNKITIIQLLNKIANGEDVPEKIIYQGITYYNVGNEKQAYYENDEGDEILFLCAVYNESHLNDEVEIIEDAEEEKDIEKIPKEKIDEYLWEYRGDEVYGLKLFVANILNDKLNEVIDTVNKLNKKGE